MRIRSITSFLDLDPQTYSTSLAQLSRCSQTLKTRLTEAGIEVQTCRLATSPFAHYTAEWSVEQSLNWIARFEQETQAAGFDFYSLGPALVEFPASYVLALDILKQSHNAFLSGVIADRFAVYPTAIQAAAHVIHEAAGIDPNGFANLQFTALANVPAGVPFFPAGFAPEGKPLSFALAVECADVVWNAFANQTSLSTARAAMLRDLEDFAAHIEPICETTALEFNIQFGGFDFSPAPYPAEGCSLGYAVEAVGKDRVGQDGSLAEAAVIADTLDQGTWKRAGFNGLMLPVLEDPGLAKRAEEGTLLVKDLLMYSAVCGTGLDTVPIPGDCSEAEIAAILFDVAALSVRLGKPLTVRLMPIPGKKAGEPTHFDFSYFAASRVLPISSGQVGQPLNGNESIPLAPRHIRRQIRQSSH
jgi:uncharacterized protein (UPF0210 family)